MPRPGVATARLLRWPAGDRPTEDLLAVEAPLEIRVEGRPVTVTMRTPGDDLDLAVGWLFAEGVVDGPADVVSVRPCREPNAVRIALAPHVRPPAPRAPIAAACGVCGAVDTDHLPVPEGAPRWTGPAMDPATLGTLPEVVRSAQVNFRHTGGIHAAARATPSGDVLDVREDVGRHNALDKLVGRAFATAALPLTDEVVVLSGRASWELLQKAIRAGAPVVAAVGAPSSAAVDLAGAHGVTLVGFLRPDGFNVYTHPDRIAL